MINIAELLKDCPNGMELDCTIWGWNIEFDHINKDEDYPIVCHDKWPDGKYNIRTFTKYGYYSISDSECVIFPKGKTTWEGFQKPFKDGDIVFYDNCVSIFKEWGDETLFRNYVKVDIDGRQPMLCDKTHSNGKGIKREARFATEEEKEKLFKAIKDNNYRWNPETKTLEKLIVPKFKVGDKVKDKNNREWFVAQVSKKHFSISSMPNGEGYFVLIDDQDDFSLVPNKFDITTLKAFESRVLVKPESNSFWMPSFFGFYRKEDTCPFICCNGFSYKYCIPYNDDTKHLLGTTNDCDDYYKTWE